MASNLFKITVVQHWLYDCWIDRKGWPCAKDTPGARFVKARKDNFDHLTLRLSGVEVRSSKREPKQGFARASPEPHVPPAHNYR